MAELQFTGRKLELKQFNDLLQKRTASLVVLRGRRRVGKSRLVEQFAKGKTFYHFTGLAPDEGVTDQDQRDEFALQLSEQTQLPEIVADDWSKLFMLLAERVKKGRVIVLFDEITWMAHNDPTFLGKLKNAWDKFFSKNSKIIFIICGSISAWIEKHILNSTGFIGRISLEMVLKELSLFDCSQLFNVLGFNRSVREKLTCLSLTGCIPWYIEQINPAFSAEDNISHLCFEPNALMVKEFKRIFHDLFGRRGDIYQAIVQTLAKQSLEYSEIAKAIQYSTGTALTNYLEELVSSNYITKFMAWDISNIKASGIIRYRLSDNYLRFYFKYMKPKLEAIQAGRYRKVEISQLPGWRSMCGLQFENLVLNNRELIWETLNINPADIVMENPFIQRKSTKAEGCQIDYLIQTRFQTLFACEIKFSMELLTTTLIKQMQEKLRKLKVPRNYAVLPVLIHLGNDSDAIIDTGYFIKVIDISNYF